MSVPAPASLAGAERFVDLAGMVESCEVGGFRADFVSWGHYRPEYWRNYWHSHSFHEVCLAYSGEGRFNCGPAEYEVRAGDVFLARPGDVHEIESSRTAPLGIAFWGFTFRPVAGVSGTGWWSGLTRSDGPVVSRELGGLAAVVGALAGEAAEPRSGYGEVVAALGAALVLETARAFALPSDLSVEPIARDRGPVAVEAMQRHLLDNLARPVTVREVAAAVHLSERHAERLFRQVVGSSMMATLRRLRLELAAQLLLEPSRSITQIAHACGYSDVRPFSTAFKRHYGRTPGEFRRTGGTSFG
ncbi:helix-turn-helix domain-containing protein [Kribbella sp. CA-293567]|uniref:helix-turn-helix domain-containing protein n=1 Tax=Kribbella sp. CA-293567 TaxID=3002436 RepID=UPI0022DDED40|nr:AraC family transcriptional regulator [Kribbella sp. CA-293567]WBQ03194.1 AraC family transcriptional regulator [Kribbella sp. CA-293567]